MKVMYSGLMFSKIIPISETLKATSARGLVMSRIEPDLLRGFLIHVLSNPRRYSINVVREQNHLVIAAKDFYAWLFQHGYDVSFNIASGIFAKHIKACLEELKGKNLIVNYQFEKTSMHKHIRVHIIIPTGNA